MGICHKIIGPKLSVVLFLLFIFLGLNQVQAVNLKDAFKDTSGAPLEATAVQGAGFNTTATFQTIISKVITMALGLMGVIFLILAIYAGYSWMMAGGNEETVAKATKTLTNAVLGLIIVLAAYALSRFIVATLGPLVFK